jgi:adenosine deaminase
VTQEEYLREYVAPEVCRDLTDFLRYPASAITLLQTKEHLEKALRQLVRELAMDRVIYAEIRFAPLLHTAEGLTPEEVVSALCRAAEAAEQETGVVTRLILCTLRHFQVDQSMETTQLALAFRERGVVGLDLAADEGFSLNAHIPAFRLAAENGLPCTAHAGEARGQASVSETLEFLGPRRIGHGVRSIEDPELVHYLAQHHIHLEICPSSNLQTVVFARMTEHSVDALYRAGISLSINTDGRGLTQTTLSREYALVAQAFGWQTDDFLLVNRMALQAAFIPAETRELIRPGLEAGYASLARP